MKTAKLVRKGKGWMLEGEKIISIPGDFSLTDDMNGQEVEFDNTGGPVQLIRFNGKDYMKKKHNTSNSSPQNRDFRDPQNRGFQRGTQTQSRERFERNRNHAEDPARAPYNFVPLNKEVVEGQGVKPFDKFDSLLKSGTIVLKITALTDIFTRGRLEKFFSVNGNFAIPGSSLRGLIRSLTEIVSYSAMEMVEKKRKLFFRNISDNYFKEIFLDVKGSDIQQKSKAGWLSKSGVKYFLEEATSFYKVNRNTLRKFRLDRDVIYHFEDIWFDPSSVQKNHKKEIVRNGRVIKTLNLHYNKVRYISLSRKPGFIKGTLLITGLFGSTKHFQWIIPPPTKGALKHDVTSILEDYEKDENRDEGADLLKALRRASSESIPCFFIVNDSGNPAAIGHTGIFRYPYKHEIGNAIPQEIIANPDMAQCVFGYASTQNSNESILAGKVFFEDAFATNITGTEFGAMRILSSPKPTSFQLYLEQPEGENHHWGTDAHKIRGNKLYWHSNADWRNSDPDIVVTDQNKNELILKALKLKETQFTVGEVLKSGSTFTGRIRFENLTQEELGALLFVLNLPENCAHKLGMGKSIGLGSVRITPTLTIINRQKRYETIFKKDDNWVTGELKEENQQEFKTAFAKYIGEKTRQKNVKDAESYWSNDLRMGELKHLLTFEHDMKSADVDWNSRTRYMEIEHPDNHNEYKGRPILPNPSEVIKKDNYKTN